MQDVVVRFSRRVSFTELGQLLVGELRCYADVFDKLGVGAFIGLAGIVGAGFGARDLQHVPQQIGQRFLGEASPDGFVTLAADQAVQEAFAPVSERRGPCVGGRRIVRQQQVEFRLPLRELAVAAAEDRIELRSAFLPCRAVVRHALHDLREPGRTGGLALGGEARAQQAVRLRNLPGRAAAAQRVLQFVVIDCCFHNVRRRAARGNDPMERAAPPRADAIRQRAFDSARTRFYIAGMAEEPNVTFEGELKRLEQRVDALVRVCDELKEENRTLKQRQDALTAERATLLQKNEQVRARVEAMIGRLKAMEQGG